LKVFESLIFEEIQNYIPQPIFLFLTFLPKKAFQPSIPADPIMACWPSSSAQLGGVFHLLTPEPLPPLASAAALCAADGRSPPRVSS
jgi:hypothetical protein